MAAYLIFTRIRTTDSAAMEQYTSLARASLASQPVTPLVAYGEQQILEGDAHEGMVVMSFPDRETALGWYNSPAYVEARSHRLRGAQYQVTLVQGV
ncbi:MULTISPECIES: DUF1330 domain-containing protein [unclassified Sphingomonas]|uniref:DUF1330 domain-containing protein n=1 Tax=unclassified Sphingomonas TaxID=196159 RepID=UPI000830B5E5|nr:MULTISPECIES: DUF1330 domain-containing protein [unclassified Sphingomonas]